ncbi:MAG: hypothetical protein QXG65_01410 [Thermoplasmata archaeon]
MIDDSELEGNLLEFRQKSFQFVRSESVAGRDYAVFARTETESESRLRPQLVHLTVAVPREWLAYDAAIDLLRIAPGGSLAPRRPGLAVESAAEPSEFEEEGTAWVRLAPEDRAFVYLPRERARALGPEAVRRLVHR